MIKKLIFLCLFNFNIFSTDSMLNFENLTKVLALSRVLKFAEENLGKISLISATSGTVLNLYKNGPKDTAKKAGILLGLTTVTFGGLYLFDDQFKNTVNNKFKFYTLKNEENRLKEEDKNIKDQLNLTAKERDKELQELDNKLLKLNNDKKIQLIQEKVLTKNLFIAIKYETLFLDALKEYLKESDDVKYGSVKSLMNNCNDPFNLLLKLEINKSNSENREENRMILQLNIQNNNYYSEKFYGESAKKLNELEEKRKKLENSILGIN